MDSRSLNPYKSVGRALQEVRESLGLSQAALALIANTSQPTVSRWERGLSAPDLVQADAIERSTGKDLRVF